MKSYRKELHFHLPTRRGLVNITREVQKAVTESGVKEGLVLVNAMNGGEIDCIIAALSAPLQEDFIIKNKNLLDVRIFLGIGKTTLPVCRNGFLTGKIGQFLVKSIFKREIEKSRQK